MRPYQNFWEITILQTKMYIGKTADSFGHKKWGTPIPELFSSTQLSQQGSEVFFFDQFPEYLLILISPLFIGPCVTKFKLSI